MLETLREYAGEALLGAEGAEPVLVVEVTSPRTRTNDLDAKVAYYHRAKVPFYLIADATGRGTRRRIALIGARRNPGTRRLALRPKLPSRVLRR